MIYRGQGKRSETRARHKLVFYRYDGKVHKKRRRLIGTWRAQERDIWGFRRQPMREEHDEGEIEADGDEQETHLGSEGEWEIEGERAELRERAKLGCGRKPQLPPSFHPKHVKRTKYVF